VLVVGGEQVAPGDQVNTTRSTVDAYFLRVTVEAALKLAQVARKAGDQRTVEYCLQTARDALAKVEAALQDEAMAAAHPQLRETADTLRRALALDG
jgi:hypothetical protein